MLEELLNLDKNFFILINNGMANSFFDWLCPVLRTQEFWYPLYIIIILLIIKLYKYESWKILLAVAVMVVFSDQFSANLVKNTFMRIRPCNEPALSGIVRHLTSSCNGYSFISAHATNHFAVAVFLSFYFQKYWKWVWFVTIPWASSIAFSQVYVGVHYPLDVIVGTAVGILFGIAFGRYSLKYVNIKDR